MSHMVESGGVHIYVEVEVEKNTQVSNNTVSTYNMSTGIVLTQFEV